MTNEYIRNLISRCGHAYLILFFDTLDMPMELDECLEVNISKSMEQ